MSSVHLADAAELAARHPDTVPPSTSKAGFAFGQYTQQFVAVEE